MISLLRVAADSLSNALEPRMPLGFGDCEIDLERRELWRAKRAVHVEPQMFDLLVYLLQNRHRVVSKDDLIASVWRGRIVSESTLTSHAFGAHMGWADMSMMAPIAQRAELSAVRADGEDPWAHHGLAYVYLFARRFDDSLAEFELALRLNPNFSLAQAVYGVARCYCGRWEEGDPAARCAAAHEIRSLRFIMA
jgi:tetratricopeptide (TPR) repeat protein